MKTKVKNSFKAFVLIALLLSPFACKDSFLEVPVTGQLSERQLITETGLNGLLIGVYSSLNGRGFGWMGGATNWLWGSIRGGDANKGTDAGDFSDINPFVRYEVEPTNGLLGNKWNGSYEGISRANVLLNNLEQADVPDAFKQGVSAEARFLRAHYYFELKRVFNMVPWIDETLDLNGAIEVPNNTDIWPKIEADFQYAIDNLPETQPQVGRANSWAARAYLGKVYMYQDKFNEAKALFDQVIANGVTPNGLKYGLVDNFPDAFQAATKNHEESVFAMQAAANTGSVNNTNHEMAMNYPYNTGPSGPGNCCGFFAPSFELANSYRTTANGLPLLDGSYRNPANELVTDMGVLSSDPFTPDPGPVDPRLDHTMGRRGIMFLDWQEHPGFAWIRDQAHAGPYTPKKHSYYRSDIGTLQDGSSWTPGYTAWNFIVLRYADILLLAAEAEVEASNGSLEKAREYVNIVRERAQNSLLLDENGIPEANYVISTYDTPWTDKNLAREAVRFERKLELALEGERFFDLVRWGIAENVLNTYINYEVQYLPQQFQGASFVAPQDLYAPIPQRQIDLQGEEVLEQNPGYF